MADFNKTETGRPASPPQRPPPIPPQKARASASGPFARAKAFLEIRRLRAADVLRRHKRVAVAAGVAIVVVAGVGVAWSLDALPELDLFSPQTLAEARANARAHPKEADAQRALGHALYASKHRAAAVAAYRHALALDPAAADDRMVENLVASFGTAQQDEAEGLIWKNKLLDAQPKLEKLVGSRSHAVRWGAVQTLDRLKKGNVSNWETAYILDLDSPTCDVRRRAVDKLGQIGTQRAVKALRSAKAADEKTDGWFSSPCLGDRLQDAEKQILARR
jgi:tetratricopeptide (TPR) repeat protein